jgi:4-hydroxybenzoate polyprenyltransferase
LSKILTSLKNFNELVMFQHSIFSLPFIFIAMIVSADGWFGWYLLFMGALAAVTARNFAMGLNRYADRDVDAKNPRTSSRPSVDGRISAGSILAFTVANALGFIAVAYFINDLALYLSVPILFVLGSYSYFKRFSSLAHIILGVSLGLAPIAGSVAVEATIPLWTLFLGVGVLFWVAGFDLLYSLQDIDFDKGAGLHSIPSRFGAKNTFKIAQVFHLLTIVFWYLFVKETDLGLFAYVAVGFSALMLAYEHYLVNKDFTKIDRAFFTINGYLGIIFIILIILEKAF